MHPADPARDGSDSRRVGAREAAARLRARASSQDGVRREVRPLQAAPHGADQSRPPAARRRRRHQHGKQPACLAAFARRQHRHVTRAQPPEFSIFHCDHLKDYNVIYGAVMFCSVP